MIRLAAVRDLCDVAVLHKASILELCQDYYTSEQLAEWTSLLRPEVYASLLGSHHVLVAEQADALVGFAILDLKHALINAAYVHTGAVRRGVGRAMITELEHTARGQGVGSLHLNATLNAAPFYERLGYEQTGRASNRLPSGLELPCVCMSKVLPMP